MEKNKTKYYGPWWGCPWFHGQSCWRAPRLKAGAGGCRPARLPAHSPIDALSSGCLAKAGLVVATWGGAHGVAPGTGVCRVLTGIH